MILIGLPLVALFVISLGGYLSTEILKGIYNKHYANDATESYKYTAVLSFIGAAALIILSGAEFSASPFSVLLGLLFGITIMGHSCASSVAIQMGPWAYTSVLVALAVVIPAFSGAVIWDEPLSWLDFVGLVFMIVCILLSVKKDKESKKASIKWLLSCVIAMVCMAGIGLVQKTHQSSSHKSEITVFLTTAFIFSAICSTVIYLLKSRSVKERNERTSVKLPKRDKLRAYLIMICAGFSLALNHNINLYLSGALDSVVFFPSMCACELLGITLASLLLFKERLSRRQWMGFVCGIIAVLLLCL